MKKRIIAILMLLAAAAALVACSRAAAEENSGTEIIGRFVRGENAYLIVDEKDGTPVSMTASGLDKDVFDSYSTGDRIRVVCSLIAETYPAQTDISHIELLEEGKPGDVPAEAMSKLRELGRIK